MIKTTFIKKITAGILRNHKMTALERNIMHPERDWLLGIFMGAIIVAIAAIWSVNTYVQFKNISVTSSGQTSDSIIYKENLVNSALSDFAKRKETYELLKQELLSQKLIPAAIVAPRELPAEAIVETEKPMMIDSIDRADVVPSLVEDSRASDVLKAE